MIKLRAHHLLCYVFYQGKGYNTQFRDNMDQIYKRLNKEPIMVVTGCDMLCKVCPNQVKENVCKTQEHVLKLDKKVIEHFYLEIGICYDYSLWRQNIIKSLDADLFKEICGECKWYLSGVCNLELLK